MCTLHALYCSIKDSHYSFPFSSLHKPHHNLTHHDGNTGTPQVTCCIGTEAQGCTQAPERQGKEKNVASRKRSLAEVLEERKANTPSLLPQQHSHLRRHPHRRWLFHQTSSLLEPVPLPTIVYHQIAYRSSSSASEMVYFFNPCSPSPPPSSTPEASWEVVSLLHTKTTIDFDVANSHFEIN